jgi:hypothetical protein
MRQHCRRHCGSRPDAAGEPTSDEGQSARLFLCALCRRQVLICSRCDRGQIYCAEGCAGEARRRAQRAAAARYQRSYRGRLKHAMRAGRYRTRANKVTHQGSRRTSLNGLLAPGATSASASASLTSLGRHCHWCGRLCSAAVRQGFLSDGRMPRQIV